MKVLWLCNIPLPAISQDCSLPIDNGGGWLVGLANDLIKSKEAKITICFPVDKSKNLLEGKVEGLSYFGFPRQISNPTKYDVSIEPYLKEITEKVQPDVVHIWGTEFPHSLAMTKVFPYPDKTVINVQGLCHIIALHYYANLPYKVIKAITFRDFVRHDNLVQQREKFKTRGQFELQALSQVNHVIGRTTWDKACTYQANSNAQYHFCNETLRDEFYVHQWDINQCEKHSIFVSQGGYPIKGLHFVLKAMPQILQEFPDTHLYIAGQDITKYDTVKDKIKITSYGKYIRSLVKRYGLSKHITFTGILNERQMCERFLKSHVFVSASIIENESNSLSEAKILGVPSVVSFAGGVSDRIEQGIDGFIYQADAPYMLAYYVNRIFNNDELALAISEKAKLHAQKTYNRGNNLNAMLQIYHDITVEKDY